MASEKELTRRIISQELHAHPYVRFTAPAHILRLSFFAEVEPGPDERKPLVDLVRTLGLETTYDTPRHRIDAGVRAGLGRIVVAWERHTEFIAYTLFLYDLEIPFVPFGYDMMALLPDGWLRQFAAEPLVAVRATVGSKSDMPPTIEEMMAIFENRTLNASGVMDGRASAWTAYRIHTDGLGRVAVVSNDLSAQELGRTVDRLLTIEDLYHLTLLSHALAQEAKPALRDAEERLHTETIELRGAGSADAKREIVDTLLQLAGEVEQIRARVAYRFGASAAYFALLESRFTELREVKLPHLLSLRRFLMRRLKPAAETYRGTLDRLADLSERIDRTAELLRTSISLTVEQQNLQLLEGVNRSSRSQLRLQQAIETLSIVVITYYLVELIAYMLRAAVRAGAPLDVDLVAGALTPLLLLVMWLVIHRIQKKSART